jgi:hypothetical protein
MIRLPNHIWIYPHVPIRIIKGPPAEIFLQGNKKGLTLNKEIFMLRLFLAVTILGLFLFGAVGIRSAQAEPKIKMSIYLENDNAASVHSDWYYPCCNRGTWTFKFFRTDNYSSLNSVTFSIEGVDVIRVYGQEATPGWHTESGTAIADPQIHNSLYISIFDPGHDIFGYMSNGVNYWDYLPTHPQPGP